MRSVRRKGAEIDCRALKTGENSWKKIRKQLIGNRAKELAHLHSERCLFVTETVDIWD